MLSAYTEEPESGLLHRAIHHMKQFFNTRETQDIESRKNGQDVVFLFCVSGVLYLRYVGALKST